MKRLLTMVIIALSASSCQSTKNLAGFSSPEQVVQTFISAGVAMDRDLLSQCFHQESPREWEEIRNKTISDTKLRELNKFVTGAEITGTEMTDWGAIVLVKFASRDENIKVVKEGERWVIGDF